MRGSTARGVKMDAQALNNTAKYRVLARLGRWRVERGGACQATFDAPDDAIAHACRSAKADASMGWLAIVTAETTPQEMHYYVPALDATSAPPAKAPRLHLISGD
jgi:hypothetical protein